MMCTPEEMNNTPMYKKFIAGIISGGVGITFATPADVIKVKMQAQARGLSDTHFRGNIDCFRQTVSKFGYEALTYGMGANVARTSVMAAVEIIAYDTTKEFIHNKTSMEAEQTSMYILYGFNAGFFG